RGVVEVGACPGRLLVCRDRRRAPARVRRKRKVRSLAEEHAQAREETLEARAAGDEGERVRAGSKPPGELDLDRPRASREDLDTLAVEPHLERLRGAAQEVRGRDLAVSLDAEGAAE